MKRHLLAAIVTSFGIALAAAAFAQGRHDEKPHGSNKPSVDSSESYSPRMTGGRHDERPHGVRRTASNKVESTKPSGSDKDGK